MSQQSHFQELNQKRALHNCDKASPGLRPELFLLADNDEKLTARQQVWHSKKWDHPQKGPCEQTLTQSSPLEVLSARGWRCPWRYLAFPPVPMPMGQAQCGTQRPPEAWWPSGQELPRFPPAEPVHRAATVSVHLQSAVGGAPSSQGQAHGRHPINACYVTGI